MKRLVIAAVLILATGCVTTPDRPSAQETSDPADTQSAATARAQGTPVQVWATNYYLLEAQLAASGVPLRNMSDQAIGPVLSQRDWCAAAIEGSVRVEGVTYNFAGVRDPAQGPCAAHPPSARVRWKRSDHPFGEGSRNNPLVPFRTLACDLGTVSGSQAWVPGGFPTFGQKLYIPAADGVVLPDGTTHDGIFTCGDVGGAITGNHIDVFIGAVRGGERGAREINPFTFIKSRPDATTQAFLLP